MSRPRSPASGAGEAGGQPRDLLPAGGRPHGAQAGQLEQRELVTSRRNKICDSVERILNPEC